MRRSIDSALGVVEGIVDQAVPGQDVPSVEELFTVIRDFERIEFDVPDRADSDGFLFQYGQVNWFPDPTFVVGFVRQLEIVDAGGEHEAYSQVQLEFRYRVDADLDPIQSHSSWWFAESQGPFDGWLEAVKQNPVWRAIRGKVPAAFDVSQEMA
ncbi:hypothetical protein GQF42_35460 [Streptomyces broussonetiae]|uniref:Uncharacterized protein n=1 Tax=Streptomyces broussonetiae TaxID=2686304 RepID=A0A6I6NIT5_9ACTN|nr:hypothetical protein [Streptomyces broussonetiae]QHA07887.1 hypothetical protein GQF42_35460 [Streptomyces broussonetiae]